MIINNRSINNKRLIIILSVLCLTVNIICVVVWRVYPNDLPLILTSLAYYLLLGVLCFFSGKMKRSTVILGAIFGFEILIELIAILFKFKIPAIIKILYYPIGTSNYAITEFIHSFEEIEEIISDWIYFAAFVAVQLLFLGINLAGKRILSKNNKCNGFHIGIK